MDLNYQHLKTEYEQVVDQLSRTTDSKELARLGRRQAELAPMVQIIDRLEKLKVEIPEHEKLVAENSELSEMAAAELPALRSEQAKLLEDLRIAMLPKDPYDEKN